MRFNSTDNEILAEGAGTDEDLLLTPKGSGVVRGPGGAALGGGYAFIEQQTASASAQIDFALPAGFELYQLVIFGLVPATDDTELYCRFSNNGGSTFRSGASDYGYAILTQGSGAGGGSLASTGAAQILLAHTASGNGIGNAAGEAAAYVFDIFSARNSSIFTRINATSASYTGGNGNFQRMTGGGQVRTAETNDAVRFLMSTGNITSGTFILTGLPTIS